MFSGNGVGEQIVGGGTRAQGLGGGGLGLADSMGFNSDNPALAAFSLRTLIRMSGQFGYWETSSNGKKDTDAEFLWKDFFVYFPVMKAWRIGVGAAPQMRMNVRMFQNRVAVFDTAAPFAYEEDGSWQGGRVDLRLDNSVKLSDKLALGLSSAYIMVRDERNRALLLPQIPGHAYYDSLSYDEVETFRGFTFSLGGHFAPTDRLGFGVVFRPQMSGHWDYGLSKSGGGRSLSRRRSGHSPGEIGLGASYRFARRFVGIADIRAGQWQAGDLGIIADSAGTIRPVNPLFLSLGVERQAGHAPIQTGFETWGYRAGLYYRKHYWPLRNNMPVEDFGVTGGVSIPVAGHAGWLHVAAEGGIRGRDENKLGAQETYFRGSLQLEISETWFQKTRPRIPK